MKKLILLICCIIFTGIVNAQNDTIKKVTVTIITKTPKKIKTTFVVSIDFQGENLGREYLGKSIIEGKDETYSVVDKTNIALKLTDENILYSELKSSYINFDITPDGIDTWDFYYSVEIKTSDGKYYTSNGEQKITENERLRLNTFTEKKSKVADAVKSKDESTCKFMYLNAIDFDFNDSKTGYVGHLNMYKMPKERWGFNAGLMKINYTNDSTVISRQDYVRMNPLNPALADTTYLNQWNKYTQKVKNTSFSIYFQPLYKLFEVSKRNNNNIYFHGHIELLITKYETTTAITNVASDTVTVSADQIPANMIYKPENKVTTSQKFLNGYFGLGATFDLHLTEKSSLFFQPTFGTTTNSPRPASVNETDFSYIKNVNSWSGFYLIRSYYRNKLEKSEIIIGTDIRGLLPRYAPYYSVYVGLNVDVEALVSLIK